MVAVAAKKDAASGEPTIPQHSFSVAVEHALANIEETALNDTPENQKRWYAIKLFERDDKVAKKIRLAPTVRQQFRKHATRGCRLTGPERQQPFSTSRGAAVIFSEADLSGDLLRRRCRNRQLCADELTELRQRKGRAGKRNTPAYRKRYTDVFL